MDDLIAVSTIRASFLVTLDCGHRWVSDAPVPTGLRLVCPRCVPDEEPMRPLTVVVDCMLWEPTAHRVAGEWSAHGVHW